ncbi:pyridoxal-phosphate dependent enzyme [Flavitalea sp. BT771]|uniref:pyridoxal-phosphate dependent enzyme n=1 Tax=Flavitalea sp. BT771 TaxID=3063329 RepID=UPI0026E1AF4E|nr:pyridoxal-phosphate dependent enzyme [Flavitalea sp. BT771]MDO6428947.1 pyridoxal-phosphate dependent enzyme [Flavitalea sp. BT771]MDV6218925.1 pyridoxal-phosphate dependent enzyme [Flavitalea sp. BT771]
MELLEKIKTVKSLIGNTPVVQLRNAPCRLFAKLEYMSFWGSIKDRAAYNILYNAIAEDLINEDTVIVESTSGNFGIALGGICKMLSLKFIPVIDPNIVSEKESLLRLLSHDVIKVTERDATEGYLLTRIKAVAAYKAENKNAYNPNQYENRHNYLAYYYTLAEEIVNSFPKLDYLFVSVSTGGTITGLSLKLKEKFKDIKIIAVDVQGSLIFSDQAKPRSISGIGASMRSAIINKALIDDVIILSQHEIVKGCTDLLNGQGIFVGASAGAAYYAANCYLQERGEKDKTALFVCPDKGTAYLDNIYNKEWVKSNIN